MKKRCIYFLFAVLFVLIATIPALSEEDVYQKNKHTAEFGIGCADCHKENPPVEKVRTEKCQECHGSLKEIGEKTNFPDKANPHINHNEELYCEDCHHIHRKSENYCLQCHETEYKVP